MVDKAFLVGVDDLRELCEELKSYSLSVIAMKTVSRLKTRGAGFLTN